MDTFHSKEPGCTELENPGNCNQKKKVYKVKATVKPKHGASSWEDKVERGQVLTSQEPQEKGAWIQRLEQAGGGNAKARPPPRGASQEPGVGVGRLVRGREGVAVSS